MQHPRSTKPSLSDPAGRSSQRWATTQLPLAFSLSLTTLGCFGSVSDPDADPAGVPGDPMTMPDPGQPSTPGTPTDPPPSKPLPTGACGGPTFATVLTREQYINTVGDLLGFDVRPMVKFSDASGRKYRPSNTISDLQAEALTATATAIADQAVAGDNLKRVTGCDVAAKGEATCADTFLDGFGPRALRRPLSADMRTDLRALFDAGRAEGGFATGVKWVIDGLLQSPDFLYHFHAAPAGAKTGDVVALNDYELANRLSYFLWNSAPDEELSAAASRGGLRTSKDLAAQVERMRKHPRAARAREDFYRNLFALDILGGLLRDDPAYTPALGGALEKSILSGVHAGYENGAVEAFMSSTTMFVDTTLAKLYGGAGATADMKPVTYGATERRGILTHPALMTILAEHDTSDPIKRGTFVYRKMLCQPLSDPPDDVPDLPVLRPDLTTRERLVEHRNSPACQACHQLFDPFGLAFENFDQLGRFRSTEHGEKVDSSGEILQSGLGIEGTFADGFALLDKVSKSPGIKSCLADQWYEYATSRDIVADDKCALDGIKSAFAKSGNLNELLIGIATSDAFRNRRVSDL